MIRSARTSSGNRPPEPLLQRSHDLHPLQRIHPQFGDRGVEFQPVCTLLRNPSHFLQDDLFGRLSASIACGTRRFRLADLLSVPARRRRLRNLSCPRTFPFGPWHRAILARIGYLKGLSHFPPSNNGERIVQIPLATRVTLDLAARCLRHTSCFDEQHGIQAEFVLLGYLASNGPNDFLGIRGSMPLDLLNDNKPLLPVDLDQKDPAALST